MPFMGRMSWNGYHINLVTFLLRPQEQLAFLVSRLRSTRYMGEIVKFTIMEDTFINESG